jgi:hypothetical protein
MVALPFQNHSFPTRLPRKSSLAPCRFDVQSSHLHVNGCILLGFMYTRTGNRWFFPHHGCSPYWAPRSPLPQALRIESGGSQPRRRARSPWHSHDFFGDFQQFFAKKPETNEVTQRFLEPNKNTHYAHFYIVNALTVVAWNINGWTWAPLSTPGGSGIWGKVPPRSSSWQHPNLGSAAALLAQNKYPKLAQDNVAKSKDSFYMLHKLHTSFTRHQPVVIRLTSSDISNILPHFTTCKNDMLPS